jgi:hypothetical protein
MHWLCANYSDAGKKIGAFVLTAINDNAYDNWRHFHLRNRTTSG